jgi:L-iditol 2-dehydrogenase
VLHRLPDVLPFEHAALIEPFAIALHAVSRARLQPGGAVVVLGAGMIGLALVQALNQTGPGQLFVVDIAQDRLELARKFGATHTINSAQQDASAVILEMTGAKGADSAFEAVGVSATVKLALQSVRKVERWSWSAMSPQRSTFCCSWQ